MIISNLTLLILFSFIYVVGLSYLYFSKDRINNGENKIYRILLVENLISLILQFLCDFSSYYYFKMPIVISDLIFKAYLISFFAFIILIIIYVIEVSFNKKRLFKIIFFALFWILSMIVLFLPNSLFRDEINRIYYTYGAGVNFTFIVSAILSSILFAIVIIKRKKITSKKSIPILLFLLFGLIGMGIQILHPELVITTVMESWICCLMYFTIENPDMKMINELNIAKDQAVKANAAKTDFLSSMSHEIRTPLNAIVGFSESLKEEQLSSEAKEEVGDIIDASSTLLEIVNGILDISKIEANKIEIVNSNYHFNKIFNELIALSKARLGDSKPIEFKYKMDESIPGTLYGDYARIKQVILNLLTNSIKYTESGYIDFQVNSIINDNVCRLIVSVEDSGKGIKKESINKLFTKFERLDEKNTTIEGTGLGLAITKKLVELMNGKIVVQSIYGKGSKFTVIIDQRIVATEDANFEEAKEEETNIIKQYPNKKLLIVDDNQLNLKVAARLLRNYECQIEEVDSGYKVLDLIASGNKYDLILMDDMMPKLSGIDTLHRLKENPTFNMPVVALTANAISGMREKYLAEGFDEYLAKPIEKNELNEIMLKFLDK